MPVTYGGGIRSNEVALDVVKSGAESYLKSALKDVEVLVNIVGSLGSSAVAAAMIIDGQERISMLRGLVLKSHQENSAIYYSNLRPPV